MATSTTTAKTIEDTWTRENCILAGQTYHQKYGEVPTQAHFFPAYAAKSKRDDKDILVQRFQQDGCYPHAATITKVFGNFSEFQKACGFTPVRSGGSAATKIKRLKEMQKSLAS